MKRTSWRALLIAAGAVLAAVASAKAEYHPTLGRWMQRDPVGYVDGMGLYEYVRSNPAALLDWLGLRALSEKEAAAFKKMRRLIDEAKGRKGFEDFAADLEKVKQELLERIKKIEEGSQDPEDLAFVLEALKEWVDDPGDRWGLGWGGIGSKSFTPGSSAKWEKGIFLSSPTRPITVRNSPLETSAFRPYLLTSSTTFSTSSLVASAFIIIMFLSCN